MKHSKLSIAALLTLTVILLASIGCDGGQQVCTETVRGINRTSTAKLYYPCSPSGQLPASTMSSGWTAGLSAIEWLSRPMASQGVVVLAFTPANVMGMVEQWQAAHKNTHQKLKEINRSHRVLAGKIDESKMQIAGYSKGGGGTLAAAAQLGSSVATAVGMAPYCGGEYSMSILRNMRAATFIQAGGVADTLARPNMTWQEYQSLPNGISKLYKRHSAWGHLEWAYGLNQGTIKEEIFAFMAYYLRGDTSGTRYLENRTGVDRYEWVK